MTVKTFMLGELAQNTLLEALNDISGAVGSTMGPGGRSFGYDKINQDYSKTASFSKDGLTVLRALDYDDPAYDAVLQYCRQAAAHSVIASGDGTTSTIVLAAAVANAIKKSKHKSPQYFARVIEKDADKAIKAIKTEAINNKKAVETVALTSANGDEELAEVVLNAVNRSTAFGTILTVKNPASPVRYSVDSQEGYSNCSGYNYNATFAVSVDQNAAASRPMEWENPYVVLFNGSLLMEDQISPIINAWTEACKVSARKLLVIAYDVGEAVTNVLLPLNRRLAKHNLGVFVSKPKLTAEVNAGLHILRDIASFCGVTDEHIVDGGNYRNVTQEYFGTCGKTMVTTVETMFLGRAENHWVTTRVQQNESIAESSRSDFDREITKIRNAELAEGLIKVEIGGGLLPDLQEREDRFDDSSKAAQACLRAGALPGAGCSYIRAGDKADVHPVLREALSAVYKRVFENFGAEDIQEDFTPEEGVSIKISPDGLSHSVGNAVDMGILDAAETVTAVIRNGVNLGVKIATLGGFMYRGKNESGR